jgi:hypothetical protein
MRARLVVPCSLALLAGITVAEPAGDDPALPAQPETPLLPAMPPQVEPAAEPAPTEPPRTDRLRDYMDQVRAQRRAQIEQLRAESREDGERARQQHRESIDEQARARREQLERWQVPAAPPAPLSPPGDWSNPWYYRGW